MVQDLFYKREVSNGCNMIETETFVVQRRDFGYDSYSVLVDRVFACLFIDAGRSGFGIFDKDLIRISVWSLINHHRT